MKRRFNKILLVTPSYAGSAYAKGDLPETGIGYISQFLSDHGFEYDVMDMSLDYTFEDLVQKIEAFKPDLIGFSFKSFRYGNSYDLITMVKTRFPDIKIVTGGAHTSVFREKTMDGCPAIDFCVVGEGENTIIELCDGNKLETIKGLYFRKGKKIIFNGERDRIQNLDQIAFPKYDKFELKKYWYPARYIITSRGCPYQCIFCSIRLVIGRQWYARSPESVFEEIHYWYDRGYRFFEFPDDNFTLVKERVHKLLDLIIASDMKNLTLNCPNAVRADKVDYETLAKMKKAGFRHLSLGVEVGNDRMLEYIKKGERMEAIERAIKTGVELGFEVKIFFIIGFPSQGEKDIQDAFDLALKYPIHQASFYNLIPYPGTELYDQAVTHGYLRSHPEEYLARVNTRVQEPLLDTPELTVEEKKRLLKKGLEVSRLVRKRYHIRVMKRHGLAGKLAGALYEKGLPPTFMFEHFLKFKNRYLTKSDDALKQGSVPA